MIAERSWLDVPLSKLIEQRREFIQIDDLAAYKRCRVQLHAQGIVLRDSVLGSAIKTKKQQVCHAGEFLVAEIDAKVGGFGIVPESLEGAIASSHYFLFKLDERSLDRRFLDYFIRTRHFRDQVMAQGSTNYASIRPEDVLGYMIPLPPLDEQRRTVARIEEVAARIEEANGIKEITMLESNRFWKVLSRIARTSDYPVKQLEEMADFLDARRIPLKESERSSRKGSYPYFGASGIIDYIDDFIFDEELLLLSEDGANLIYRSTPIAFIAEGKYWVNNHAHVLRPKAEIADLKFLKYALSDYDVSIYNYASAQPKLNQKNARRIKFPLPPINEQRRIVDYLDGMQSKLDALKRHQAQTADELDALMPSILDKAFRGDL